MNSSSNGYVTWKALIGIIIGLTTVGIGLATAAWQVHESRPHASAVQQGELERLSKQIYNRLDRIENKVDKSIDDRP